MKKKKQEKVRECIDLEDDVDSSKVEDFKTFADNINKKLKLTNHSSKNTYTRLPAHTENILAELDALEEEEAEGNDNDGNFTVEWFTKTIDNQSYFKQRNWITHFMQQPIKFKQLAFMNKVIF